MVLGITIAAEVAGKTVMNTGLASQLRPRKYYTISRETLDASIGDVHELINFVVIEAQRILFAENIWASVSVCLPLLFRLLQRAIVSNLSFPGLRQRLPRLLARQDCAVLGPCSHCNHHPLHRPLDLHLQPGAYRPAPEAGVRHH